MKIIKIKTLNEAIEELGEKNYGVMDHNLADALRDEKENKKKAADLMVEAGKDAPVEERDAHTKVVKTPELKKMYLSESLFDDWDEDDEEDKIDTLYHDASEEELRKMGTFDNLKDEDSLNESWNDDLNHDVYNALTDIAFDYHQNKGIDLTDKDFSVACDWFLTHFGSGDAEWSFDASEDEDLNESINGNTSHANEFINALRSAGFGDGFDQKLKIDTYGNGGTTISYKDQGGQFTVTITDDKVILEGQDEGEEPFKNEYTEWGKFVTEFNELYPGIPVGEDLEDCQRYPVEGTKQVDLTLNEDNNSKIDRIRKRLSYLDWDNIDPKTEKFPSKEAKAEILSYLNKKGRKDAADLLSNMEVYLTGDPEVVGYIVDSELVLNKELSIDEVFEVALMELSKLLNESLNEASYTRSDDKIMLVKQNREPLVDVIQMTLTDGEWGYVKSPDGTITPSLLPHLSYDIHNVGVTFDNEGRYFVRVWDTDEESLQKVVDVAKQFNREYKIGVDKYAKGPKKWYCLIYLNEETDFDDPYVDPEAEVNREGIKGRGTKVRGNPNARHARDNEDLEDSQRYPIESPLPAQTGLTLNEDENVLEEDVQMNGSLMEDKIAIDMIHDFKPEAGVAEETFNRILEAGKMETFEFSLEDRFPNGVTTEELNKVLSEEAQWIYDQLGMKEYLTPNNEE